VFFEIGGIGHLLKVTADGGLRFVRLGPDHAMKPLFAAANVSVTSKEIRCARAETQQLRHDGIVIVVLGQMAIGAVLRCANA
jgi:hypothetical protein